MNASTQQRQPKSRLFGSTISMLLDLQYERLLGLHVVIMGTGKAPTSCACTDCVEH
ncbi:MAG: hypothetical protein ACI9NT_002167 [Bacteroidia bacterium]|jgi:hypothetical protein